jgi:hypothetical protein
MDHWITGLGVCRFSIPNDGYSAEDVLRGAAWYEAHRAHVDRLLATDGANFPMSGSDIGHPELWKAGGWRYFLDVYFPVISRVKKIQSNPKIRNAKSAEETF